MPSRVFANESVLVETFIELIRSVSTGCHLQNPLMTRARLSTTPTHTSTTKAAADQPPSNGSTLRLLHKPASAASGEPPVTALKKERLAATSGAR